MTDSVEPVDPVAHRVADPLRRRAEAVVIADANASLDMSSARARKLIHELRVHQAELVIQTEELAETQATLQTSLRRYTELYESAPIGYLTIDERARIISANALAISYLAEDGGTLAGASLNQLVDAADRESLRACVEDAMSGAAAPAGCTVSVMRPHAPARVLKVMIARTPGAAETRVSLSDITAMELERQVNLDRLETIERMLRLTVNRELELIELKSAVVARDATIEHLRARTGLTPTPPDDSATSEPLERQSASLHASADIPLDRIVDDTELEPTLRAFLSLLEDLESVEQLRMVTRMKDRFIALVSHELRTPLTSIAGFTSTLLDRWELIGDGDRRAFLEIIDAQADRMIRLVNDLLVLSRIQAGELDPEPEFVDVAMAAARAAETFPDAEIVISCGTGLRAFVDPDHLHQALVNYLGNAIKYGAEPIEVSARQHDSHVDILVRDTGPGVPPDFVPRLFSEFAQARPADPTTQQGTGLGLSIVRQLMHVQGGDAWYEPVEPHGACFVVRIPLGIES